MKKHCFYILILAFLAGPPVFGDTRTIAHQVLELEVRVGMNPNAKLLDALMNKVKQHIQTQKVYSRTEALSIFKRIHSLLINLNFIYDGRIQLLSESLTPYQLNSHQIEYIRRVDPNHAGIDFKNKASLQRIILSSEAHKRHVLKHRYEAFYFTECKTLSFIYLGIADVLNLPIYMVLVPGHVFVRWHLNDGSYLNWETTSGRSLNDSSIKALFDISAISIQYGVYLKSLSRRESMGTAYYMLGNFVRDPEAKISYFTQGIALNPKHSRAYYNRGTLWYQKRNLHKALADYNQAIALDPKQSEAYNNRGNIWYEKKMTDKALADYKQALFLNPKHSRAYNNRGNIWYQKGHLKRALENYNQAIQLDPSYSSAYSNRGNVWYEMGKLDKALKDYNQAIALDPKNKNAYLNREKILR